VDKLYHNRAIREHQLDIILYITTEKKGQKNGKKRNE
jgi:hypothetical protein